MRRECGAANRRNVPTCARLMACAMLVLAACSGGGDDETGRGVDAADVVADGPDSVDAEPDAEDAGDHDGTPDAPPPDADGSVDADDADAEDVEADTVVEPECDPPERPVGELCREPHDRACIDDDDCRDAEACFWAADDSLTGTCIYTPAPPLVCPDAAACPAVADAPFRAGFALRDITPMGWELARPGFAQDPDAHGNPRKFVGDVSDPTMFCDCGRDMICPPGPGYEGCPSTGEYPGPDADGTEGDSLMQGNWIAGFGGGKNAAFCPDDWLADDCVGAHCCYAAWAHDPIWARGVVFDQGETRVAFVTVDTIGYFYNDLGRQAAALPDEWGVDHLVVSATHTHSGPDTMGRWGPGVFGVDLPTDTGRVPAWHDEIHEAIVALVGEAVERLEPVDVYAMHVNTGATGFATRDSRDPFIFADLLTGMHFVRAGTDATMPGNTVGTLVNWHSHPEAVAGGNVYVSSDYPHWFRQHLEQGLAARSDEFPARDGLGGVSIFVAGTVGGLMTPLRAPVVDRDGTVYRDDTWEKARALGERLADLALATFATPCPDDDPHGYGCAAHLDEPDLSFATAEILLDVTNVNLQAGAISLDIFQRPIFNWRYSDGNLGDSNMPKLLTALTQLRIGEVAFQSVPGELFPETMTGGFEPDNAFGNPIVGNPNDVNCASDRRERLADDVEPRFPCLIRASNPNPPPIDAAPRDGYLYDTIPGAYLVLVGNGNDALGYLVPSYDFEVHPDFGVLVDVPGSHYEETVSVGDELPELLELIEALTGALDT